MRIFFLIVLLAGTGLAAIYPWAMTNFSGDEIGVIRVFERGAGFRSVTVRLTPDEEPVRVLIDVTGLRGQVITRQNTELLVTVSTGGRTVLSSTVQFSESQSRQNSPQEPEPIFRDEAGVLTDIVAGDYDFTIAPGAASEIQIRAVDLVLRGGAGGYDSRAQPIGFSLMAVGFIGLVLALRRGRRGGRPENPNSQPPPPRWGRDGGAR